jgi:hypothetical protein
MSGDGPSGTPPDPEQVTGTDPTFPGVVPGVPGAARNSRGASSAGTPAVDTPGPQVEGTDPTFAGSTDPRTGMAPPPVAPALTGDWPAQAADAVVDLVGTVRDKTVAPLLKVARAVVYGVLIAVVGTMALVLSVIFAIRIIDVYLPGDVWSAYLLLGSIFTLAGFVMWSRRKPSSA